MMTLAKRDHKAGEGESRLDAEGPGALDASVGEALGEKHVVLVGVVELFHEEPGEAAHEGADLGVPWVGQKWNGWT